MYVGISTQLTRIHVPPQLFSAIKMQVDREKTNGQFWLTGSQKFQLMRGITESLAGRVAIVDLLGLSQGCLRNTRIERRQKVGAGGTAIIRRSFANSAPARLPEYNYRRRHKRFEAAEHPLRQWQPTSGHPRAIRSRMSHRT